MQNFDDISIKRYTQILQLKLTFLMLMPVKLFVFNVKSIYFINSCHILFVSNIQLCDMQMVYSKVSRKNYSEEITLKNSEAKTSFWEFYSFVGKLSEQLPTWRNWNITTLSCCFEPTSSVRMNSLFCTPLENLCYLSFVSKLHVLVEHFNSTSRGW